MSAQATCRVHFGGPDSAPGALRELLAARIEAVPRGGRIDFVTYYFRDRRLARALLRAHERGVRVHVAIEARPREAHANDAVIALLSEGLGPAFRAVTHRRAPGVRAPRLHEKLYCFSDPPAAFVGSFNPSGDAPEQQPGLLQAIGDHDRGYNLLVELRDPALVRGLVAHADAIRGGLHGPLERLAPAANAVLRSGAFAVHFWPRLRPHPLDARLARLGAGARVRLVASHLRGGASVRALASAAARGVDVGLVSHASERRFPRSAQRRLEAAGVTVRRAGSESAVPMHDKFALIEQGEARTAVFGSFNLNPQSRLLNHEIGVFASDAALFEALERRHALLLAAVDADDAAAGSPAGERHRAQ